MSLLIIVFLALLSPLVFLFPKKHKVWASLGLVCCGVAVSCTIAISVLAGGETARETVQLGSLLGIEDMAMDGMSALFVLIISAVALSVIIYSRGYLNASMAIKPAVHISMHYMALTLLFYSMLLVVTWRGGYGFLFSWELMTISSFMLILFDAQRKDVRKAALNYLIMMHIGFVFLLWGFVCLSIQGLPVSFDSLQAYFLTNASTPVIVIFLIGFGMKSGLFPLHIWLPDAYHAAPAHISAFMSGAMSKMGVYGMLRVLSYMNVTNGDLYTAGIILFVVGIVTGIWGVILAAVQNDAKRLLAYSSIENMAIIFIAIGAAAIGRAEHNAMLALYAMGGALLHTVNHSFFKPLLFFGAGNVQYAIKTTSIESMGGLAKRMPVTAVLFAVGAVAICALPPLSGFASEFLIYFGLVDAVASNDSSVIVAVCGMVALAFIGGVVIIAFSKLYGVMFLGSPRSEVVDQAEEADVFRIGACAIPIAVILAVGLVPWVFVSGIFDIAGSILGITNASKLYQAAHMQQLSIVLGILVVVVVLLIVVRRLCLSKRKVEISSTWGCGFGAPSSNMQYTGESFTEGLQSMVPTITGDAGGDNTVEREELFPKRHNFTIRRRDRIGELFSAWWVEILRHINMRVMRLRTGKVNNYILYALLFLLLIMVLSFLDMM